MKKLIIKNNKIIISAITALFILSGCASNQQRDSWNSYVANQNRLNDTGAIKDSKLYENLYYEIQTKKLPDQRFLPMFMEMYSTKIDAAIAYESGKISKERYERIKREASTKFIRDRDNLDAQIAQQRSQALYNAGVVMERMGTPMMYRNPY